MFFLINLGVRGLLRQYSRIKRKKETVHIHVDWHGLE